MGSAKRQPAKVKAANLWAGMRDAYLSRPYDCNSPHNLDASAKDRLWGRCACGGRQVALGKMIDSGQTAKNKRIC